MLVFFNYPVCLCCILYLKAI
uniref:Uncharacterized protein n=1 Tax=Anguilla anguilla TaxID=7936 RepID=A0A0E9V852_ANGAN